MASFEQAAGLVVGNYAALHASRLGGGGCQRKKSPVAAVESGYYDGQHENTECERKQICSPDRQQRNNDSQSNWQQQGREGDQKRRQVSGANFEAASNGWDQGFMPQEC